MPATRTVRRDVVLRVPKAILPAQQSPPSHQAGEGSEGRGDQPPRRSQSPAKKAASEPQGGSAEGREGSGYEHASQATSAAEWNSLLIWARRQRGPQWDAATGIWQVDNQSREYYSFSNDPACQTKLSTAADEEVSSRAAQGEGSLNATEDAIARTGEGEGDSQAMAPYYIEDSPPIGPGGRRSRAR